MQTRQYSLSDSPHDNYYRISIKRESGENAIDPTFKRGLISTLMHDTKNVGDIIRVSAPQGAFFLDEHAASDAPLVLISGGVGLTPLTSMLDALAAGNSTRPISWIHGGRLGSVRPFKEHIRDIANTHENVKTTIFSDEVQPDEIPGVDFHFKGSVDLGRLDGDKKLFLNSNAAQYYVCGPPRFMQYVQKTLRECGVRDGRIHTEKFGTGEIPAIG
jgi:nitric oxide dioxygenase